MAESRTRDRLQHGAFGVRLDPAMFLPVAAWNISLGSNSPWPTNNLVLYIPFSPPRTEDVVRVGWVNGSTASANIQVGIYDAAGNRLVTSGTVAQSGTAAVQTSTVAAVRISQGLRYYFGVAGETATTVTFQGTGTTIVAGCGQALGLMSETPGAFGLPATWTPTVPTMDMVPAVFYASRAV